MEENIRLAFDVAEQEFGISPLMTVEEMSSVGEPDSLSMVMYLSQFYQLHKDLLRPAGENEHCNTFFYYSKWTDLRSDESSDGCVGKAAGVSVCFSLPESEC